MTAPHVVGFKFKNIYEAECITPCGETRWKTRVPNLVHNDGLDHALAIITATAHVSAWYVGLLSTGYTPNGTHSATTAAFTGQIITPFSEATLPAFTAGAIASQSVDNSASKASFSVTSTATNVGGFYLVNSNINAGPSTGSILFGTATIAARTVQNGDTLNVQITIGSEVT